MVASKLRSTLNRAVFSLIAALVAATLLTVAYAAEPRQGGTLVYGRGSDSVKLDPAVVTDGESMKVTRQIFDTLVQYTKGNTKIQPALAVSWTSSSDGKVWTFKLRSGVKFHDGTPFNADAVVYNFKRWMDPKRKQSFAYFDYMFGSPVKNQTIIKSVEAVDALTVRFTLKDSLAPFLANLAMPPFGMASPAALKKYGEDISKNPVGTGAFRFAQWIRDDRIVLDANKTFWAGRPNVDRLIFRVIPDNSARFLELQAGTIDIMDGLNPSDVGAARSSGSLHLYMRPAFNVGYVAMNFEKKPFDDVRVRMAVNYAVNKPAIVDAFYGDQGFVAKNPMPPSLWGYNQTLKDFTYDSAKAKQLLKEAGFPNGFETTLWAMPNPRDYFPEPRKIAEAVQADLAAVGIRAKIVSYDWDTYLEKTMNGEHDMAMLGWVGDNGDPDNFLYVLLDKDNAVKGTAGNIAFYRSDELHDILIKAQRTPDQKERERLYNKAQEIIHQDAPWVTMVHATPPIATRAVVQGYVPHSTGVEELKDVWKSR